MRRHCHTAPLALASDGSILVNIHHVHGDDDPAQLLDLACELGEGVFIGVVASRADIKPGLTQLDDAATSIAAHVLGARMSRMKHPGVSRRRRRP